MVQPSLVVEVDEVDDEEVDGEVVEVDEVVDDDEDELA